MVTRTTVPSTAHSSLPRTLTVLEDITGNTEEAVAEGNSPTMTMACSSSCKRRRRATGVTVTTS